MSKIGCFSDIHLGICHDDKLWHDIILNFADWASSFYKEKDIKTIFIPGDIFHNRNEIGVETLHTAKQFFDFFKDFKVYISAGNHDSFLKHESIINSISILDGWNNITIVDKECLTLKVENKTICFVPWGTPIELIPKCDMIFGHFEINSFYMNNYKVCEKGLNSSDLFKKSKFIVSGHFHKKDFREYKNGKILYVGSPYQQNFGDALDERGIYIIDIANETYEFFKNDASPEHIKINLSDLIDSDYDYSKVENNITKFIIDKNLEHEKILKHKEDIIKNKPLIFKTEYQLSENINIDVLDEQFSLDESSFVKDIETYLSKTDIEHKKEVVDYLKELYNSLVCIKKK
jgi:DNA repair exonuclease SbcCD nuclease subunit